MFHITFTRSTPLSNGNCQYYRVMCYQLSRNKTRDLSMCCFAFEFLIENKISIYYISIVVSAGNSQSICQRKR